MKSQQMIFPSEYNPVSLEYFNCELVEVTSFCSEWKKKWEEKKEK